MAKERSVDEYLGFAHHGDEKRGDSAGASTAALSVHGAYEDSWHQVLKAQAEEDEAARSEHDPEA